MTARLQNTVRNTVIQLGMQATSKQVVETLETFGIEVSESYVARVKRKMLRDESTAARARLNKPPRSNRRRRPQQRKILSRRR